MPKLLEKHKRHLTSVVFILGFVLDNLTLTRVDLFYDNLVLTAYLIIACFGIVISHLYAEGRLDHIHRKPFWIFISRWHPLLVQFSFGGLFSGYVIFYSRSGSFIESWPFLLFLVSVIAGNELIKKRHFLTFQLSVFFVAIFSYAIFSLPVLLGKIGADIFLLSGFISLAVFALLTIVLKFLSPIRTDRLRFILTSVGVIYLLFNAAYFSNAIPPIPLSPKEIGIYHSVTRLPDGNYAVTFEPDTKFFFFKGVSKKFNRVSNEPVYAYSSVFAPTSIDTKVFHRWSYYNREKGAWLVSDRFEFPLFGGRDGGYRGYSVKENIFPGKWRVDVVTERGQLIERIEFKVVSANIAPNLESSLR